MFGQTYFSVNPLVLATIHHDGFDENDLPYPLPGDSTSAVTSMVPQTSTDAALKVPTVTVMVMFVDAGGTMIMMSPYPPFSLLGIESWDENLLLSSRS
jgi:hypothetical protein